MRQLQEEVKYTKLLTTKIYVADKNPMIFPTEKLKMEKKPAGKRLRVWAAEGLT